jgi:hypothetical protein
MPDPRCVNRAANAGSPANVTNSSAGIEILGEAVPDIFAGIATINFSGFE